MRDFAEVEQDLTQRGFSKLQRESFFHLYMYVFDAIEEEFELHAARSDAAFEYFHREAESAFDRFLDRVDVWLEEALGPHMPEIGANHNLTDDPEFQNRLTNKLAHAFMEAAEKLNISYYRFLTPDTVQRAFPMDAPYLNS